MIRIRIWITRRLSRLFGMDTSELDEAIAENNRLRQEIREAKRQQS